MKRFATTSIRAINSSGILIEADKMYEISKPRLSKRHCSGVSVHVTELDGTVVEEGGKPVRFCASLFSYKNKDGVRVKNQLEDEDDED